ncbi:hypothetical protein [Psychrobacillus sp. FSL K6-1464]|uniref:hypothetical protein n=1 Tax=Psychrobacillus sp. FSL K6-1464 TaxID=2921545 RepID=UPI0030FA1A30
MPKVLIEKDVAEAIEYYKKGLGARVTFMNRNQLDERLTKIDDWTLARALIEGYEPVDKIVIGLS